MIKIVFIAEEIGSFHSKNVVTVIKQLFKEKNSKMEFFIAVDLRVPIIILFCLQI